MKYITRQKIIDAFRFVATTKIEAEEFVKKHGLAVEILKIKNKYCLVFERDKEFNVIQNGDYISINENGIYELWTEAYFKKYYKEYLGNE